MVICMFEGDYMKTCNETVDVNKHEQKKKGLNNKKNRDAWVFLIPSILSYDTSFYNIIKKWYGK